MTINVGKIVAQANCCAVNTTQTLINVSRLSGVTQAMNCIYSVPCLACLPLACNNKGRWIFVCSTNDYRYSDGTSWTNDFASCNVCCSNIWGWGANNCGYIGDGTTTDRTAPVREICSSTDWCFVDTSSGSCPNGSSLGIKTNGQIWSWGSGNCGQLGNNSVVTQTSPVREMTSSTWCLAGLGQVHAAAIKSDGSLWSWGAGNAGRLGNNAATNRSSPVQEISSNTTWCALGVGIVNTSAIRTNGTLWTWGSNCCGQIGDNTTTNRLSPVQELTNSTNWCAVTMGSAAVSAIKTDGSLWSWGLNLTGDLGDGTTEYRYSPVREISCGTRWRKVARKSRSTAAIKIDGTLWTWGAGSNGRLADNSTLDRCSPVQEITSATNWCQVNIHLHGAAINTKNEMWAWGVNNKYQLGDGTSVTRCSPVRESTSATNWCLVAVGQGNVGAGNYSGTTLAIQSVFCKGFHSV